MQNNVGIEPVGKIQADTVQPDQEPMGSLHSLLFTCPLFIYWGIAHHTDPQYLNWSTYRIRALASYMGVNVGEVT